VEKDLEDTAVNPPRRMGSLGREKEDTLKSRKEGLSGTKPRLRGHSRTGGRNMACLASMAYRREPRVNEDSDANFAGR